MASLKNVTINDTGHITIPKGTTAQRPGTSSAGMIRYNTETGVTEYYNGTKWVNMLTGEDIVTNGLVLWLDAGQIRSYPGTGTTWYDLSGNGYNGTLTNGPTYSTANGGVVVLDGSNDYIDVPINLTNMSYTIMGAARYVVAVGRTFSGKNNNWLMGHWGSSPVKHYAEGWVTNSTANEESDTNWRIYAATGNYSSDLWEFYVNGTLRASNNGGSNGPNGLAIGGHAGTSEFSNSHVSFVLAYNRVLTSTEIQQNFNALRGRYGL